MSKISRLSSAAKVTVAQSAALSGAIDFTIYASGSIKTPAALTATTKLAFKVAEEENGTYVPLYDAANALVEITVQVDASRAYPLPETLFGCSYFKIWTEASGADVAQAAARSFTVMLKG